LNYQLNDKTSLHFDYTYFNYLAQQAGGLTDVMFNQTDRATGLGRLEFICLKIRA
jgi:Fe(3+) dicitrate transport protein